MEPSIPMLSTVGFSASPSTILTKQFEYFLVADYSQSNLYRTKIASLKWILANTNDNIADTKASIVRYITGMYENYFDSTSVIVDVEEDKTSILYNIDVVATKNDTEYTLSVNLNLTNNKIQNLKEAIERIHM